MYSIKYYIGDAAEYIDRTEHETLAEVVVTLLASGFPYRHVVEDSAGVVVDNVRLVRKAVELAAG